MTLAGDELDTSAKSTATEEALAGRLRRSWLPFRRGRVASFLLNVLVVIAYLAALIGIWQAIVSIWHIKQYLLPSPLDVWRAGKHYPHLILSSCWVTVYESLVGFALAVGFGLLLAIVVTLVPLLKRIVVPSVVAFNTVPKVALAPIMVVVLGLGAWSKIMMAFLIAFFPVLINEVTGLEDTDASLLEYMRLLQANRLQIVFKARLPNSLPALCSGMRIAMSLAVTGALVGEFVAASHGLGYEITIAYSSLETPLVFALVIVVSIAASLLYFALVLFEKLLFWRYPARWVND